MFRRKNHPKQTPQTPKGPVPPGEWIVPRTELVVALARASYDGNRAAVSAAQRLLRATDESGRDYLRV